MGYKTIKEFIRKKEDDFIGKRLTNHMPDFYGSFSNTLFRAFGLFLLRLLG